MFFSIKRYSIAETIAKELNRISNLFLKNFFIPLLPFFILGFVFKLEHEQLLARALKTYGPVFFIVIGTQVLYITFLFLISANFSVKTMSNYIKNIIPAIITGFSTSSSAATMPVLINSTEKNLKDPSMAKTIIPATINIHTLGSALGLTIISLTTLLTFGHNIPVVSDFLRFAFFYAIAKFGVAAVPGGVIIVVIPLLESHLGFTNEMVGLITAIYMLFDPFGTASNVAGNGVFAIIFSKIHKLSSTKKQKPEVNILPKTR
jgi:Na+/H+-dicarboxylate symporter